MNASRTKCDTCTMLKRQIGFELGELTDARRKIYKTGDLEAASLEVKHRQGKVSETRSRLNEHQADCPAAAKGGPAFAGLHNDYVAPRVELPPAADIIALVKAGTSYDELAASYGCSGSTVRSRVTESGLLARNGKNTSDVRVAMVGLSPAWMEGALCAQTDPEAFFPNKGESTHPAKAVCIHCPVAAECLDWALENNERFGIWGGLSERERRRIKKGRPLPAPRMCELEDCDQLIPASANSNRRFCSQSHARRRQDDRKLGSGAVA